MRVLVIEDDASVARVVARALETAAYAVDVSATATDGTARALRHSYDAILLDLELPDHDGMDVVRALRTTGSTTPILIMTGRGDDAHVVRGLDAGADDYLLKPVSGDVLAARVRAAIRRSAPAEQLTLGALTVDRLGRTVTAKGRAITLTPKEFAMLEALLLRAEHVVSRTALLEAVWNMHFDPGSNIVDAHVARLRQKLRPALALPAIRTVRGTGFVLTMHPDEDF